jgi:hypothetical protein
MLPSRKLDDPAGYPATHLVGHQSATVSRGMSSSSSAVGRLGITSSWGITSSCRGSLPQLLQEQSRGHIVLGTLVFDHRASSIRTDRVATAVPAWPATKL